MEPLVTIACITYNHAKFIHQAIDGFLMQKTTFPFEILIHDDASTDGTIKIIEEYRNQYPDIIFPIYQKENQYSKGVKRILMTFVFPKCNAKYIALCEGDDYWTDPFKLQKQVDFLEKNEEYSLCCGGFESYNEITKARCIINKCIPGLNDPGFSFGLDGMLKDWITKTLTVLFRKDAMSEYLTIQYKFTRDVHLFYHLIKRGRGYYFNQIFGVYRIHYGSVHSIISDNARLNTAYNCYKELYERNRDEFTRKSALGSILLLFNFDLYHTYKENNLSKKVNLFFSALHLAKGIKEYIRILGSFVPSRIIGSFVPSRIKNLLKNWFSNL